MCRTDALCQNATSCTENGLAEIGFQEISIHCHNTFNSMTLDDLINGKLIVHYPQNVFLLLQIDSFLTFKSFS